MSGMRLKYSKLLTLLAIVSLGAFSLYYLQQQHPPPIPSATGPVASTSSPAPDGPPGIKGAKPLDPLEYKNTKTHPIDKLVRDSEASWLALLQRQSSTLEAAVAEYKRRYKIPPPPNFDKWYEFAKRKNVQLIDEYDTIHHSLLPFWALPPGTIRARVRESLGFSANNLMGLLIRDGKVQLVENGQEWLEEAIVGMVGSFVQYLPDMDLAFNIHDEPRVVVPHDELSHLVNVATNEKHPAALANPSPKNAFSSRPADVNNGKRVTEVKTTRFNVFAHQQTWLPSRLSCSPDSPARTLEQEAADDRSTYALGDLGFVYNHTAFSDICNSPSLGSTHGFFDRPNAFNVIHDLFPVFSQSKMSSFQDILYPSPWYWFGKVQYEESKDYDWKAKISKLYWRGSTTGGFSRDGGWRRQHRQQMVRQLNAIDQAKILRDVNKNTGDSNTETHWEVKEVTRTDFRDSMDVRFSHVGQCDPGDCDAQREFFDIADEEDQQNAWKFRYLLDMDGNAFSGRFYAFLKSRSMVFKMAVFREWHEEWIKPWVHYVPLSLQGGEALEAVRYFSAEEEGARQGVRLAESGRAWAKSSLRNADFEAWFFRLLLE